MKLFHPPLSASNIKYGDDDKSRIKQVESHKFETTARVTNSPETPKQMEKQQK